MVGVGSNIGGTHTALAIGTNQVSPRISSLMEVRATTPRSVAQEGMMDEGMGQPKRWSPA